MHVPPDSEIVRFGYSNSLSQVLCDELSLHVRVCISTACSADCAGKDAHAL